MNRADAPLGRLGAHHLSALAFVLLLGSAPPGGANSRAEPPEAQLPPVPPTVVLARSDSPYRALAQEVARRESIPLVESVAEALALRPTFLLWVVAPRELSDAVVTTFSLALDRSSSRPSAGLITGSTLAHARNLYERASQAHGNRAAAVLGAMVFSAPQIVETVGEHEQSRPLSRSADVLELLRHFDYVHYAGHGGSGYWRPLTNERISAYEVSRLPPVVISTMACNTARIWEQGSIALRIVDEGAAAYSGFYYSPMAGFQIGEHDGPFRRTWPDVPIGFIIEAMNEGARKGYATFPFHLLLGDPRIALRSEPPCRLLDQGESGGVRTVSCLGAPSGLVPVRIRGGARYAFVDIPGVTAAWDREPFFNRRVQMATIGEDRVILVEHHGGDLRITLRRQPPVIWLATDPLADALDDLLISMADRRHGGDVIALALAAVATTAAAVRARRRRPKRIDLLTAAAVGVIAAALHASYALGRQQALVVIAKNIVFSPLAAAGTGVLAACGAVFFLAARSWRGRVLGTIIATSVGWVGGLIGLGMSIMMNAAIASRTAIGVWIYRVDVYGFILSALECCVYAVTFWVAKRIAAGARTDTNRAAN
jgi:hypothetical protein